MQRCGIQLFNRHGGCCLRLFLWLRGWLGLRNYRLAIRIRRRTASYNLISLASDCVASSFGYKLVPGNGINALRPSNIAEVGVIGQYTGIQELVPKCRRKNQVVVFVGGEAVREHFRIVTRLDCEMIVIGPCGY